MTEEQKNKSNKTIPDIYEFRGYVKEELKYTFPWHWIDHIEPTEGGMLVTYDNELKYNTETEEITFDTIFVDYIDVK